MNIICDVAGRFDELMRLVKKMPDEEFLFVGDLNDRGPQSKEVIEWVMKNGKCLQSNHGDMFVDFYERVVEGKKGRYGGDLFLWNGGGPTLKSYGIGEENFEGPILSNTMKEEMEKKIPKEHIEYLKNLPYYHKSKGLFASHAAKAVKRKLKDVCHNRMDSFSPDNIIWNRGLPGPMEDRIQILGHNSHWGLKYFGTMDKPWAICIDTTRTDTLTGINFPTLDIYQEEYDKPKTVFDEIDDDES